MSTHKLYFRREIRKILSGYPLLSGAMEFESVSEQLMSWSDCANSCADLDCHSARALKCHF